MQIKGIQRMKTVKVRIAVEVNANGKWQATGADDYVVEGFAGADVGNPFESVFYWVEAELPVPDPLSFPVYRGTPTFAPDVAESFFKDSDLQPEDQK
jgi:hypothetical protein